MLTNATLHIAEYSQILSQIINEIYEHTFLKQYSKEHLSKTQFSILKILAIAETHTVSELADILNISKPAISKNVEKLVRQNYVNRRIVEEDRRIVKVSLTNSGMTLIDLFEKMSLEKQDRALTKFSNNDRVMFSELFKKYVRNCLENESNVEAICIQCKGNLSGDCIISEFNENCRFYLKSN